MRGFSTETHGPGAAVVSTRGPEHPLAVCLGAVNVTSYRTGRKKASAALMQRAPSVREEGKSEEHPPDQRRCPVAPTVTMGC